LPGIISKVQDKAVNITNYISTDFIYSYKAETVGCRSRTAEDWHVDIAVMSCHVVQLQGLASAVGSSTANHTDM